MTYPGLLYPPVYPGLPVWRQGTPPPLPPRPKAPDLTGWRYIATRLNGDGSETVLDYNVPIQGLSLREDLSGPGAITGTITPEFERLHDVFTPWSTALYVEESGIIRNGGILTQRTVTGPEMQLDFVGFTGYAVGQPYPKVFRGVNEDPADIFRMIWSTLQTQQGKNLGLFWDDTKTKIRVGDIPLAEGETKPGNNGPYTLNWWETDDLGTELDALAEFFDYRVDHEWDGPDDEKIVHKGRIGYPRLGARLDNRIVVGENIFTTPQIEYHGDAYASEVIVLGAGEGRDMRRGSAQRSTGRLGRTVTVSDESLTTNRECNARARQELKLRLGDPDITSIELLNHPHAPVGTITPGDEIRVQTPDGWDDGLDVWVRVLSKEITPETDTTVLDVTRVERV